MISHGNAFCRNLLLRISGLEAGVLPGLASGQAVARELFRAAQLRGDQLPLPAPARGVDTGSVGGGDALRVRLRGESQYANHAYPAAEERGAGHRCFPEGDRPVAHLAAAGPRSVTIAAEPEMRHRRAAGLPGAAAGGHALRIRVPP